jgi:MoxR-like ATPase
VPTVATARGVSAPPVKPTVVAAKFIPTTAPEIIGMDLARAAIGVTMAEDLLPTILVGHTGTAKTKLIQRVHQDLKWPYRGVSAHGQVEVDTLIGKWIATKDQGMVYKLGILPFCMLHGIAVGIQEINAVLPEVLILLHEYVDEGFITLQDLDPEHEWFVIEPHANFRLYGTMNPPELYPGTRDLSPALVRRCIVQSVEALPLDQEIRAVQLQCPWLDESDIRSMVGVGQSVRQQFDNEMGFFYLSTADLVQWGRVMRHMTALDAGMIAVVGKAPAGERDFVKGRVRIAFDPNSDVDDV